MYCYFFRHAGPVKPSEQLVALVNDVEKDVKDLVSENTQIVPFIIPGLKTIHAGTSGTYKGGVIGLPQYFHFNDITEVENKVLKLSVYISLIMLCILYFFAIALCNYCQLCFRRYNNILEGIVSCRKWNFKNIF